MILPLISKRSTGLADAGTGLPTLNAQTKKTQNNRLDDVFRRIPDPRGQIEPLHFIAVGQN
jgi:hypothetical protein